MSSPSSPRTDIQGLRAVAVAAVLGFHLWPAAVTGGYVGVDVFFVVSGFLITSHLLRRPIRGGRDLLDFWGRRVRRLIPAASLVLLVTLVAAAVWLPVTALAQVGREVLASALYVENWVLAASETDYLAADQLHSPVQHYWSLSIEEQFYLLWPLLLAAVAWLGVRLGRRTGDPGRVDGERPTAVLAVALTGTVVVASLGWSVWATRTEPAAAYFVSTTRFWELGLGGLLAAVLAVRSGTASGLLRHEGLRAATAWVGLAMIVASVVLYDSATAFPGYTALLPTVGTALVIAADADDTRTGPGALLRVRPVQWLGDTSYSAYLWHWPLVVIVPFAIGRELTAVDMLAVLAVTLLLAAVSRRHVEERLRWQPLLTRRLAATFVMLAGTVVVVGGAAVAVTAQATADERRAVTEARAAVAEAAPCVGATVVRDDSCEDPGLVWPPEAAAEDKPAVYDDGCWNNAPFTSRNTCTYGEEQDPTARVALVGNSHAGHWLPALEEAIDTERWRLDTYLQSVCYTVDRPLEFPGEGVSENCRDTNRWAVDSIVGGDYDLVIMSNRTNQLLADVEPADQERVAQEAYAETLATFTDAGLAVVVLRDTPAMPEDVPDCLTQHRDDPDACGAPPAVALEPDPLAAAAGADTTGAVSVTSVEDLMCDDVCHPVVGGVTAYFDHGHLTTTFARTLAPEVAGAVRAGLRSADPDEPSGP